ncbi:MAG: DNA-directed RNA polymerase subunit delta, partial [Erysipelotrichaceae bacterium]|nr:DNA-directed RNA polymerase subunit delta [Erysipelotrichaceae bacterium]
MTTRSMADIAYDILKRKKRAVQFLKMWDEVSKTSGSSQVGQFYSDLTLDPRFVCLKDNKWDLVERRKYEESHIDISK